MTSDPQLPRDAESADEALRYSAVEPASTGPTSTGPIRDLPAVVPSSIADVEGRLEPFAWTVPDWGVGERLDAFLARVCPQYSRVQLRRAISEQSVRVDGKLSKPAYRLLLGQTVLLEPPQQAPTGSLPEAIPLSIVFEDEHLAVVDKPPGMVVHPARGHWSGTLTAALAYHFESLSSVGGATRPGIVHRLDRDTSGLILVAKTDRAHLALAEQFEGRRVKKEYWALVSPVPDRDRDRIAHPIGPHPHQREKMAVRFDHPDAREALTDYAVETRFHGIAQVRAFPKTGRTHQIRVHLAFAGYPILADRLYSGRAAITRGDLSGDRDDATVVLNRQALHAQRLTFEHPLEGREVTFESPLPEDLAETLRLLKQFRGL